MITNSAGQILAGMALKLKDALISPRFITRRQRLNTDQLEIAAMGNRSLCRLD